MGLTFVNLQIGNQEGGPMVDVPEVMVDTGTYHSVFPGEALKGLAVAPLDHTEVEYANGERETIPVGQIRIRIRGHEPTFACPVYFSKAGQSLIGATTLQIFSLMVDPVREELVRRPPIQARQF